MKVLKFGGTSVGSPTRMQEVAKLVNNDTPKIVVLSAMSGTTNSLVQINNHLFRGEIAKAKEVLVNLEGLYEKHFNELYTKNETRAKIKEIFKSITDHIRTFFKDGFNTKGEREILSKGELISTNMFHQYLNELGVRSVLLPALNFMRTDKYDEPDEFYIQENIKRELSKYPDIKLFITQGYICLNGYGEVDNLKRGGSDYSASLIGEAINATDIEIWTDISGIHNNDPRIVDNTQPIERISFEEAAELAYFGAKILHPTCVLPAKHANIPLWLKNTMSPNDYGTLITNELSGKGIKAVAAKDGITALNIRSSRMFLAYGFMRRVFEIFESYKTSVDMITTSEVAITLTIDSTAHLPEILEELKRISVVEVDQNQTIVCVVGDFGPNDTVSASKVINAMKDIPVKMISYGGSSHNISLLVSTKDKELALKALSKNIF